MLLPRKAISPLYAPGLWLGLMLMLGLDISGWGAWPHVGGGGGGGGGSRSGGGGGGSPGRGPIRGLAEARPWAKEMPRFMLFGDSLTERGHQGSLGWASSLAGTYSRKVDIVVRGFSGYNTRWALLAAEDVFNCSTGDNTKLVTIMFGTNDALRSEEDPTRHIPLDEYTDNLRRMVDLVQSKGVEVVLLMTPPPIGTSTMAVPYKFEWMRTDRWNNITEQYADAVKQVGKETDSPVIDLFRLMQTKRFWETSLFDKDGVHLASAGNDLIYREIMNVIVRQYTNLRPETLPYHFPYWGDINNEEPHPEDAFILEDDL